MNVPCKECSTRKAGTKENPQSCHSGCERYKVWKADLDEKRIAYQKTIPAIELLTDAMAKSKRISHLHKKH